MELNNPYKYGVKSVFSQTLALTGLYILQSGIGIEIICPTIIIGAINDKNSDDPIMLTSDQASWFGSLLFLFTPAGSVLASALMARLGHNMCMVLTNGPYFAAMATLFYADSVTALYAAAVLMGLSIGSAGGPCSAYIGEVCEPNLRGALTSVTNVFYYVGALLFTVTYAVTADWRLAVLINACVPVVNVLILLVTPHSPMWLLAKGKREKAQQTLCKLRGWVSKEKCSNEFREMIAYTSVNCDKKDVQNDEIDDTSSWGQLIKPEVYRPFFLLVLYAFFTNLLSGIQYSPYLVSMFTEFGAPVNVDFTIAFSVFLAIIGGVLTVFTVGALGKRFLTLSTLLTCSVCYILIGLIGVFWTDSKPITSWMLLMLFLITTFASSFGIVPIMWILLTEIFPMKSRNITCSVCAALNYLMSFFMIKCYPDFAEFVQFYNTFTIFGLTGLVGCVYFYFYLPETENKTLQEISEFFK